MTSKQAKDANDDEMHPPLEDFTVVRPPIKFFNYQKLADSSQNILNLSNEISNFKISQAPLKFLWPKKSKIPLDEFLENDEPITTESLDSVDTEVLEVTPPSAASKIEMNIEKTDKLIELTKKQRNDCFNTSNDFCKEERIALSNYIDAQIRENTQKNEIVDKRPISDALRFTSKLSAFPIDVGGQRFYKYNIRCEKMEKRHKRTMEKIYQSHVHASESLMNYHQHYFTAFGDIQKISVENVKVAKVPVDN